MKKSSFSSRFAGSTSVAALLLSVSLGAMPAGALTLSLLPSSTSVAAGESVEITVRVAGLADAGAPSLGAFDLNLNFDPALLGFGAVTFGDAIRGQDLEVGAGTMEGMAGDALTGHVNLFGLSLAAPVDLDVLQAAEFTLAVVRFTALGAGTASVTATDLVFGDADGGALAATGIQDAVVDIGRSVPDSGLPSALGVMGVLGGIVGLLRSGHGRAV